MRWNDNMINDLNKIKVTILKEVDDRRTWKKNPEKAKREDRRARKRIIENYLRW